ncbi:MAG: glycine zipper 2TM domain-containing protein [Pseudomonadota bacterium]
MNTTAPTSTSTKSRLHPLVATAAVAVTIFSLAGIAAITGWLPTGKAAPGEASAVATAPAVSPALTSEQKTAAAPTPVEQSTPKPVVKAAPKPAAKPAPVEVAQAPAAAPAPAPAPVCSNCGVVDNIREITQAGEGSGLGAVAGGVVGAILGNQIGGGTGKKIATVAGAAGGAYAGHQIEKSQRKTTRYEVIVRMNDGSSRSVMLDMVPGWQVGEHVRIENGTLVRDN